MQLVKNKDKIVYKPICELEEKIVFKNGKCPYSECKNCKECIKDDDDLYIIKLLSDTKRCWLA